MVYFEREGELKVLKGLDTQGWLKLVFYPLILLFNLPVGWVKALWSARVLLDGQWEAYMGFNPRNALNSFFYRTQWFNINKYGRTGVSPVVGLGEYPLSRWFHLSSLSSCFYANAGAVSTLLGCIIWVFSHLVWVGGVDWLWVWLITFTLFFSSTAYAMAFTRQNYNMLGWMWLPLALYFLLHQYWVLASMVWLASSIASITVIMLSAPLLVFYAFYTGHYEAFLVLLPGVIKILLHLRPMLATGELKVAITNMGKLIGLSKRGVRYKRVSMRWGAFNLYFSLLYLAVCFLLWWRLGQLPLLPVIAFVLFLINQLFIRFADDQSVIIFFVSAVTAQILMMTPGVVEWLTFWLAVSPIPIILGVTEASDGDGFTKINCYPPFDHSNIETGFNEFFAEVPSGSQVYFAFKNPRGEYERLFDGYRLSIELPLYVAAKQGVHLFPDWYAVAETNYEGAPNCWGDELAEVLNNIKEWGADYVVAYRASGVGLDKSWLSEFEVLSKFDWADYSAELRGELWREGVPVPELYLLRLL